MTHGSHSHGRPARRTLQGLLLAANELKEHIRRSPCHPLVQQDSSAHAATGATEWAVEATATSR
jgi:hypothetical protein